MTYKNNNKSYEVDSVEYGGSIINVNGTSITDCDRQALLFGYNWYKPDGTFTVFANSDEIVFKNFDDAYKFAMTKQKGTFIK